MNFSPQSQAIYKILLNAGRPLTAKILAAQMHLSPSLTYRLTEPLITTGLIMRETIRPCRFSAKPIDEGLSLYLLSQNEWFLKQFSSENNIARAKNNISRTDQMQFSFIQSRDELMNKSTEELDRTTKSFDILRSGHEIPADTMLAMFKARKRGVKIRMLIQDYSGENASQIKHWKTNGILVGKTPLHRIRIMIYDSMVAYFMSYKHEDSSKDLGMKVDYQPFAVILSKLFDEWWKNAEAI
jgi:sugar-specific transcriptional regulator TrmB